MLVADAMSSEESGSEADDMFVRPLPWRSDLVNKFFSELDGKSMEKKTPQALEAAQETHDLSKCVHPHPSQRITQTGDKSLIISLTGC